VLGRKEKREADNLPSVKVNHQQPRKSSEIKASGYFALMEKCLTFCAHCTGLWTVPRDSIVITLIVFFKH
jgi:hypothetical protein